MKKWWRIEAKADVEADIYLFGQIGKDWFGEGIGALDFVKEFKAVKASKVNLHIDSPGGIIHEGMAIYNTIKQSGKEVVAYIDGMAASMASVIAMAADKIVMPKNALMMIHEARAAVMGTAEDFDKESALLKKANGQLADIYSARSKRAVVDIQAEMKEETWFTGEEAVAAGMADETDGFIKQVAFYDEKVFNFKHKDKLAVFTNSKKEEPTMSPEELKAKHPETFNALIEQGRVAGHTAGVTEGKASGAEEERKRIAALDEIKNEDNADLVAAAIADPKQTAESVAVASLKRKKGAKKEALENRSADGTELAAAAAGIAPAAPASNKAAEGEGAAPKGAITEAEAKAAKEAADAVNKLNNRR